MPAPRGKVRVLELCKNLTLTTPGGGTTWYWLEVDLSAADDWGPFLESIRAHTKTNGVTTNFEWKVACWWSTDGASWEGNNDLFSAVSADGQVIQSAYSTATTFGAKMRYAIGYRASTGSASESGSVSCWLAFTFQS